MLTTTPRPPSLIAQRLCLFALAVFPALADAQLMFGRLVPDPPELQANNRSGDVAVSADGRSVAFSSVATNWLPGDSSTTEKTIVVDLDTGLIEIASRTTAGVVVRGASPAVSRNGRYVAFLNLGGNLDVGVPTSGWQALRKDRLSGQLRLASASASGEAANNFVDDDTVSISGDGRLVAFEASSSNLGVATGGNTQVFVKDLDSGAVTLASARADGLACAGECSLFPHALSDDGRFLVMICSQPLLSGAGLQQVYVRDLQQGTTELISRADGASGVPSTSFSNRAAMAPGGRYVSFQNPSYGGLGGNPATHSGIYLRDRATQTTISIPSPSAASIGACTTSAVSDAGSVLMQCPSAGTAQVYLHVPGAAAGPYLVSSNALDAPGNLDSGSSLAINASGLALAFESAASNLTSGDSNASADVFVLVDQALISGVFADGFEN